MAGHGKMEVKEYFSQKEQRVKSPSSRSIGCSDDRKKNVQWMEGKGK